MYSKTFWLGGHLAKKFKAQIVVCHDNLRHLRQFDDENLISAYARCRDQLATLLAQEEAYWRQRAKQLWLKEGDLNTEYFHEMASSKRKCNMLTYAD